MEEKIYTVTDMLNAITYGFWYHKESMNDNIDVPEGNKLQWLQWYINSPDKDMSRYWNSEG